MLEDFDALLDDGVGFEIADGFNVDVEFVGAGGVVEEVAGLGGVFFFCVFGQRP